MIEEHLGMDGVRYSSYESADQANERFMAERRPKGEPMLGLDGMNYFGKNAVEKADDRCMLKYEAQKILSTIL